MLASDLLKMFQYQWVPILLEKEAWKEELLVIYSLEWFMSGKSFLTISSKKH